MANLAAFHSFLFCGWPIFARDSFSLKLKKSMELFSEDLILLMAKADKGLIFSIFVNIVT